MKLKSFCFVVLGFVTATGLTSGLESCSGKPVQTPASAPQPGSDSERLAAIITQYTEASKHLDPFSASYFNVEEDLSKFGDYPTPSFIERGKAIPRTALEKLASVHPENLSTKDLRTYRIFKEDITVLVAGAKFPSEYLDFNQMGNRLHQYMDDSSESLTSFPFDSVKHYEDFVKRSEGFPAYIDNQIDLLKRGVEKKLVDSCVVAEATVNTYTDGLEPEIEKNPFYRPILFMPKTFSAADQARLKSEFKTMVRDRILPGFKKFDHYFRTEYTPHCRKSFGLRSLPNGKEWYKYEILASTNLPLSPKEIHEKGLQEVVRIKKELWKVKEELGFKGTYKEFLISLTHDPRYFFTSSADMFAAFEKVKAETAKKVPDYFSLIPTHDFKIVETSNPEDAAGSYNEPTELLPYGRFVANTKNLRSVPIYDVTTLLLHETVPGHHFQLALQFEMKDELSEYQRKLFSSNSFVEGWALYSEYLGNEMGMYNDPMQRLGNLNDEMLRAVRLVVDTGIHAYGWSREKAFDYMRENLASDPKDISNEVNRYSVWPGQALGYKIGQLKIIELRRLAEKELGPRFDIKEFHKTVIGSGTVSLPVLDTQVKDWIALVKDRK
jgi:uncharacterized protein (DUF885 family)